MMGLTTGAGPFGERPWGRFDFDPPDRVHYVEPTAKHVRAERGGRTVADSRRVMLFWSTGKQPQYAFPLEDVRAEGRPVPGLDGYVSFAWDEIDAWFEEDEQVFVHPRNPYARVDALRSQRHVRVERDGVLLAESSSPVLLFETGLPTRYYLPRTDVRFAHLTPSDTRTECPYKGRTSGYWSIAGGPADVAWSYDFPAAAVLSIAGLVAFLDEAVDVVLDGVAQERPVTHFSR
jgi:uncharacterized protein (DUF427 family)